MDLTSIADKVDKLLKGRSIEAYEVYVGTSRNLSIEIKEQKVDTFKCSEPVGVSVRVLKTGGMGFSFSTSLAGGDLERMVDNAVISAENQTQDAFNGFPDPSGSDYPDIGKIYDDELAGIDERRKIECAMDLERLTLASDGRIKRVRKASFGESEYEVYLRSSTGIEGGFRATSVSASVSAVAEEGDDSQMGWDFGFGNFFADIHVEEIAATAASRAVGL